MRDPLSFVIGALALLVGGLTVLDSTTVVQVDGAVAFAAFWVGLALLGLAVSVLRLRRGHRAGPQESPQQ